MTKEIKAEDAQPGNWYEGFNTGKRLLCTHAGWGCSQFVDETGNVSPSKASGTLTPLPDCDGWDWVKPPPEPKYRPYTYEEMVDRKTAWFKSRFYDQTPTIHSITSIGPTGMAIGKEIITTKELFEFYVHLDGSPAGMPVDE